MASTPVDRCATCHGVCVPSPGVVLGVMYESAAAVVCACECCAGSVAIAAALLHEVALEQAEVVRARIAGIAERLRESGVVLRAVDIPQSDRSALLACVGSN